MLETALSIHPKGVRKSFASGVTQFFTRIQGTRSMPATNGDGFLHAVHAREYSADAPEGVAVWKYAFPLAGSLPVDDVHVRFPTPDGAVWIGIFECARGRHVDVIPWPQANAVVVVAANAVYIVDPTIPEKFNGFAAPVEINGVTFDESAQHMFVAESLRIYAFSSDRLFRWISEPLDGYGAQFRGCGGRVLAVEVRQSDPEPESEESPSVVRLRTEDGTILRSRFRLAHRYWAKRLAA